jgi:hypothetical protein
VARRKSIRDLKIDLLRGLAGFAAILCMIAFPRVLESVGMGIAAFALGPTTERVQEEVAAKKLAEEQRLKKLLRNRDAQCLRQFQRREHEGLLELSPVIPPGRAVSASGASEGDAIAAAVFRAIQGFIGALHGRIQGTRCRRVKSYAA